TIRALPGEATGRALATTIRAAFRTEPGYEPGGTSGAQDGPRGDETRERAAALETVLAIVAEVVRLDPAADRSRVTAELEGRAACCPSGSPARAAGCISPGRIGARHAAARPVEPGVVSSPGLLRVRRDRLARSADSCRRRRRFASGGSPATIRSSTRSAYGG